MRVLIDVLLAIGVAAAWLGCLGYARLTGSLARLHAATFTGCAAGPPLLIAAFLTQGASASMVKVLFLLVIGVLSGGVLSHALGRAIVTREREVSKQ